MVTVSDENNCGPKTFTFTITEPPLLVVSLINKTSMLFGAAAGTINVGVVGGTLQPTIILHGQAPNGL
jgi:hypothetical protein